MGLIQMRERIQEMSGRRQVLSTGPSPLVILASVASAGFFLIKTVLSFREGDPQLQYLGLAFAAAIPALEGWRRRRLAQRTRGGLPRGVMCPRCGSHILLTEEQRRSEIFSCNSCGRTFQVVDEETVAPTT